MFSSFEGKFCHEKKAKYAEQKGRLVSKRLLKKNGNGAL